jgi:hypothetical protein
VNDIEKFLEVMRKTNSPTASAILLPMRLAFLIAMFVAKIRKGAQEHQARKELAESIRELLGEHPDVQELAEMAANLENSTAAPSSL